MWITHIRYRRYPGRLSAGAKETSVSFYIWYKEMKYVKGAAYGTAKSVIIDAGHGGAEPGAMFEGRKEKDDTLRLALAVGEILEIMGFV